MRSRWRLLPGAAFLAAGSVALLLPGAAVRGAGTQPLALPEANQALTLNALLGTVDGQPLFAQDVLRPVDSQLRTLAAKARSVRDFRDGARDILQSALQDQISKIVVYNAARSQLSDDDQKRVEYFVDTRRQEMLSQHSGSVALTEEALRARGTTLSRRLDDLRRSAVRELYMRRLLWHRVTVTRQQLLDAYQRDLARFTIPAQVDLYTITLNVRDFLPTRPVAGSDRDAPISDPTPEQLAAAQAKAVAKARDLIKQLKAGADFARLAEDNSQDPYADNGGRRPHIKKGDLASADLENLAFSLPADTVAADPLVLPGRAPAQTQVLVVRVGDVEKGRVIPFAEAQDQLKNDLTSRQLLDLQNEFVQNMLKSAAIEAVGGTVNTPADVAAQRMLDIAVDAAVAKYAM